MSQPIGQVFAENGVISVLPVPAAQRPPGSGGPLLLVPERTAVIVVDMQRAFVEAPPFASMREIIPRIANFLGPARSSGSPVIHLKTEFDADMENAGRPGSRTRQMMEGMSGPGDGEKLLVQGCPAADIVPELTPLPSDIVVTKQRFSGFWGTALHELLRTRKIESLVFAGGTTTVCVESTLRDALFLDYNALVLSDCTADITPDLHESALSRVDLFFGWVCNSEELMRGFESIREQGNRNAREVVPI